MKSIKHIFSINEEVICSAEKNGLLLLFSSLLMLMGLLGLPSMLRAINVIMQGAYLLGNVEDFAISAIAFLFGWAIPFIVFLLFANGEIIVTNKKLYIKRGILGYIIEIPFESISCIEKASFSARGGRQFYLIVYFYNGKKLKSDTHFSDVGIDNIERVLIDKGIKKFDFTLKRDKNMKSDRQSQNPYNKHIISPLVPILVVFNLVISILMFIIVFSKFS